MSDSLSSSRPQRERKAPRTLLTEKVFRNGVVEQTLDGECGLDQPNPGGAGGKASNYEKLGSKAFEFLEVAGWCWIHTRKNLHTSWIFYVGPKKSKAIVDGLEEGVTKFTGYEALGKQYEKDGKSILKIIKRAVEASARANDNPRPINQRITGAPPRATNAPPRGIAPAAAAMPADGVVGVGTPLSTITMDLNQQDPPENNLHSRIENIEELCYGAAADAAAAKSKGLLWRVANLEKEIVGLTSTGGMKRRVEHLETAVGIKKQK